MMSPLSASGPVVSVGGWKQGKAHLRERIAAPALQAQRGVVLWRGDECDGGEAQLAQEVAFGGV